MVKHNVAQLAADSYKKQPNRIEFDFAHAVRSRDQGFCERMTDSCSPRWPALVLQRSCPLQDLLDIFFADHVHQLDPVVERLDFRAGEVWYEGLIAGYA